MSTESFTEPGQSETLCTPREILANAVKVAVPQEEKMIRTSRVFVVVEEIKSCKAELLQSSIVRAANAWEVTLLFKNVVDFRAAGRDRTLPTVDVFRKRVPFPLTEPPVPFDFSALTPRVQVTNLSCTASVGDGQQMIVRETNFTVTVLGLTEELFAVCEFVPVS